MDARQKCVICGGVTEAGFILDEFHGGRKQQEWCEGPPERSFWTGLKKPERRHSVLTLRCTKCGYLMDFAEREQTGKQ